MVGSKHSALSDEVAKEGTNLTSGAGYSNANGRFLKIERRCREVAAELLKSGDEDVLIHLHIFVL